MLEREGKRLPILSASPDQMAIRLPILIVAGPTLKQQHGFGNGCPKYLGHPGDQFLNFSSLIFCSMTVLAISMPNTPSILDEL